MSDMTMPELIVSLHKRIIKDGKRIAELEARTEQECIDDTFTAIRTNLDKAEAALAERDRWQHYAREQMSDAALREVDRRSRIQGMNP